MKGVRQGDPISPKSFTACLGVLIGKIRGQLLENIKRLVDTFRRLKENSAKNGVKPACYTAESSSSGWAGLLRDCANAARCGARGPLSHRRGWIHCSVPRLTKHAPCRPGSRRLPPLRTAALTHNSCPV